MSKYDYDIIILEDNLSTENSVILEKYWIERIGRKDLEKGSLVNLTDGGEGTGGKIVTEESKDRMRGINNPFFNMKHTEETKNVIRLSNKTREYSKESQIKRIKNSKIKTSYGDIHFNSKLVLNVESGIFYLSIREAANAHGFREDILRFYLNKKNRKKTNLIFV